MQGFLGNVECSMQATCDSAIISSIAAHLIPLPPTSPLQGEFLCVNCLCTGSLSGLEARELLQSLRSELVKLVREAGKFCRFFRGAVFVFACPGMPANSDGSISRKAYIYEILSEGLSTSADEMDIDWLSRNGSFRESSDADVIRAVLQLNHKPA